MVSSSRSGAEIKSSNSETSFIVPKMRPSLTSILRTFGLSSAGSVNPDATIMPEHPKVFVEQDVLFIPYFQSLDFGNLKGLQT
jgi:hypothetical protein